MRSLEKKLIQAEIKQRREEGCNVEAISHRIQSAIEAEADDLELSSLYDQLVALPIESDFPFSEPSTLEEIRALRPNERPDFQFQWNEDRVHDKTYGGWLGRAAGCALGKPVEGWPKSRIDKYLLDSACLPLDNYLPFSEKILPATHKPSTRGNIRFMDRDDDMDFPILGLLSLEKRGIGMTSRTAANTWMERMPFSFVYTAEQVAYRNFVGSIWPPESANYRNPFREWIGAQIRADIFGYACPGRPADAAELAFRDAAISHTKNGIYGEMFVAAMIAAAFVSDDIEEIIAAGLGEIPETSRLSEAIRNTQSWCREEDHWEKTWEKINENLGHYHTVHTINNAALVVMGLHFGEDDFQKGIVTTVRGGWDTDCTGATVGSILGVKFGAKALPKKWTSVFNDRLLSAVRGENDNKLSELAIRTVAVAEKILNSDGSYEGLAPTGLGDAVGGLWQLETGWGEQQLDFAAGTINFVNDDFGPYNIVSNSYDHPELKFSFAIDKGGWDFEVDFEGSINGDTLQGNYYPGETPVQGKRKKSLGDQSHENF